MIEASETQGIFGDEQWGSRRGRSAIDVVLLKHFTYMLMRLTETNVGRFDNDAKACYTRIIMLLALLIARKIGITAAPNEMLMNFLTKAKYHLKTLLGISDEYYTSTEEHPVHGSGQGCKGLPGFWVIVSTLIILLMKNKTDGIQFTAPLTSEEINRIIDGFVDDTTLW